MQTQELLQTIASLPPAQLVEVETFVEKMRLRDGKRREQLAAEIAEFVELHAGSKHDLDEDLEAASVEHLSESEN